MSADSDKKIIFPKHYGYDYHNLMRKNPMIDFIYEHRWAQTIVLDDPRVFEECIDEPLRTRVEQVILSKRNPPPPLPPPQDPTIDDRQPVIQVQVLHPESHSDSENHQTKNVDSELEVEENQPTSSNSVQNSPQKNADASKDASILITSDEDSSDEEFSNKRVRRVQFCVCAQKYDEANSKFCDRCSNQYHIECAGDQETQRAFKMGKHGRESIQFVCFKCRKDAALIKQHEDELKQSGRWDSDCETAVNEEAVSSSDDDIPETNQKNSPPPARNPQVSAEEKIEFIKNKYKEPNQTKLVSDLKDRRKITRTKHSPIKSSIFSKNYPSKPSMPVEKRRIFGTDRRSSKGQPESSNYRNSSPDYNSVWKNLYEDIRKRLAKEADNPPIEIDPQQLQTLCQEIYAEFQRQFRNLQQKFKQKWVSFKTNILDVKNKSFIRKVLDGTLTPAEIPQLSSDDMLDEETKEAKRKEEEAKLKMIQDAGQELNAALFKHKIAANEKMGLEKLDGIDIESNLNLDELVVSGASKSIDDSSKNNLHHVDPAPESGADQIITASKSLADSIVKNSQPPTNQTLSASPPQKPTSIVPEPVKTSDDRRPDEPKEFQPVSKFGAILKPDQINTASKSLADSIVKNSQPPTNQTLSASPPDKPASIVPEPVKTSDDRRPDEPKEFQPVSKFGAILKPPQSTIQITPKLPPPPANKTVQNNLENPKLLETSRSLDPNPTKPIDFPSSREENKQTTKRSLSISEYQSKGGVLNKAHLVSGTSPKQASPKQAPQSSPVFPSYDALPMPDAIPLKLPITIELEKKFSVNTVCTNVAEIVNNKSANIFVPKIATELALNTTLRINFVRTKEVWNWSWLTKKSYVVFEVRPGEGEKSYQWLNSQNKAPCTKDEVIFRTLSEKVEEHFSSHLVECLSAHLNEWVEKTILVFVKHKEGSDLSKFQIPLQRDKDRLLVVMILKNQEAGSALEKRVEPSNDHKRKIDATSSSESSPSTSSATANDQSDKRAKIDPRLRDPRLNRDNSRPGPVEVQNKPPQPTDHPPKPVEKETSVYESLKKMFEDYKANPNNELLKPQLDYVLANMDKLSSEEKSELAKFQSELKLSENLESQNQPQSSSTAKTEVDVLIEKLNRLPEDQQVKVRAPKSALNDYQEAFKFNEFVNRKKNLVRSFENANWTLPMEHFRVSKRNSIENVSDDDEAGGAKKSASSGNSTKSRSQSPNRQLHGRGPYIPPRGINNRFFH